MPASPPTTPVSAAGPVQESQAAPGVYIRSAQPTSDIDLLWNGSRTYFRDDRSGLFTLLVGFLAGCMVTAVLFLTVFNQPAFQHLWTPAPPAPQAMMATPVTVMKADHPNVVVEKGETLSGIVDREYHNTSPRIQQAVIQANRLKDASSIQVGQVLLLPAVTPVE